MTSHTSLQTTGKPWTKQSTHRDWLKEQARSLIRFYQPNCINPRGGFYDLDDYGHPLPTGWPPASEPWRALFATVRMIHCFSIAHLMGIPGSDEIINHGMDFLWNGHRDIKNGGYYWGVGYDGPTDATKQAYGHAFVLLSGASAKCVGHPDADRLLEDATTIIKERFWEDRHGALAEEFEEDWTPIGTYRGQNSNMHFTESCMAAFEATNDTEYLDMAKRVAGLIIQRLTASNDWMLPEHFDENWKLDPDYDLNVFRPYGITVGHMLEWARLLIQLWELDSRKVDWMREAAETMFRKAMNIGWSTKNGGFYFTLDWDGNPRETDRFWWPHAEGIGAAHALHQATGDTYYEECYRQIWSWTNAHLIDHKRGSWRFQLNDELAQITNPWYGKPDLYHSFQACLIPLLPATGSITHGLIHHGI